MAQLWMDGFDHYGDNTSNLLDGAWAAFFDGSNDVFFTTEARTGALSLGVDAISGTTNSHTGIRRVLPSEKSELFVGFGLFLPELPATSSIFGPIQFLSSGNTELITMTVSAVGGLSVRLGGNTGSIIGSTAGPVLVAGTWNHIECRLVKSIGAGIFEIRVNEVVVLSLSGVDTGSALVGQIGLSGRAEVAGLPTRFFYIDDLIVRDASGTTNNTFMGDLRIATLQPIANGANQGWTARTKVKLGVGVMNFQDPTDRDEAVTYVDNAVFEIGSGSFDIEGFVRFDNIPTTTQTFAIAAKWRESSDERSWRLYLNGPDVGGTLVFATSSDGTAGDVVEVHAFPFIPEINRWYHIAVDRDGTDSRMFIDGQQVGITKTDNRTYDDNASLLYIGGLQDTTTEALNDRSIDGWMDGVRFTVGVSRYTGNFNPPTDVLPNTVGGDPLFNSVELLLNFDSGPTVLDESSNDFTAILENAPFVEFPNDAIAFQNVDGLSVDDADFVEAALVPATGTLTFTANPLDTETVVIGATTYTFQTVLVDVANNVFIGATAEDSLDNLLAAVNAGAGEGTLYGTGTTQNASTSLIDLPDEQVLATARTPGAAGNTIVSTTTVTGASWGNATLQGGADIPANSEFTMSGIPPEVTGVRSVAIIARNFKTDSGSSELTMSFVASGGASDAGPSHPMTLTPTYYEDTFERDPNTLGALTPSTLINARIRLNRTL